MSQGHGNAFPAYRLEWQAWARCSGGFARACSACARRCRRPARPSSPTSSSISPGARRACRSKRRACGDEAALLARALAVPPAACANTAAGPLPPGVATDARPARHVIARRCARRTGWRTTAARACLRTYDGEIAAPRPPPAIRREYRLCSCRAFSRAAFAAFTPSPTSSSSARKAGFAADVLGVGGRNDIATNAKLIAEQIDAHAADDRVASCSIGHSKGAPSCWRCSPRGPTSRRASSALLTVAGALNGSPLADDLHGLYGMTLGVMPFEGLRPRRGRPGRRPHAAARARVVGARTASRLRTPLYSLVTLPDFDAPVAVAVLPYARLSSYSPRQRRHAARAGSGRAVSRLLGIVNADHLSVAIPHPGLLDVLCSAPVPFPRPQVYLAAIDVIAAQQPMSDAAHRAFEGRRGVARHRLGGRRRLEPGPPRCALLRGRRPDRAFYAGWIDDEPVATISVVKYGATFAFLGLYIVKPALAGAATACALWNHALATARGRTVGLDGVVAQQDNYKRSGFALAYRNIRYRGVRGADAPLDARVVPLSSLPFADVVAYDRAFFPEAARRVPALLDRAAGRESLGGRARRRASRATASSARAATGSRSGPLFADDAGSPKRCSRRSRCAFPRAPRSSSTFPSPTRRRSRSPSGTACRRCSRPRACTRAQAPEAAARQALRRDDVRARARPVERVRVASA